jgi:hypothetical protein
MGTCTECIAWQFGACRDKSYCLAERESLIEQAVARAAEHGHAPGEFSRRREGYSVFQAHCTRCSRVVAVDVNPAPGEPDVFGEALTVDCPGDGT